MGQKKSSEILQALRDAKSGSGKLLRLEDLVFESSLEEEVLDENPRGESVYNKDTELSVRTVAKNINAQVKEALLSGLYRIRASTAASGYDLDENALESIQLEVACVLLGLQSVPEFESTMQKHPVLSSEQGKEFADEIRRTFFSELALYLKGMGGGGDEPHSLETLSISITGDADIQARLARLPESVQAMVRSPQLEEAFASIQKKYPVAPEVAQTLSNQIVRVMVGLTTMNDFKVSVTRVAGIPPNSLDALFMDVEQNLFRPVRTTILGALQKNMGSLPGQSTPAVDPYRTPTK